MSGEKTANRQLLAELQLGDRLDRVENIVVDGMPDVNGCFSGREFWIETKCPTEPKRDGTPLFGSNHDLSLGQRNWALRQMNAGGNVFFYIVTDKWRFLVHGRYADRLNSMTVREIGLISFGNWEVGQYKRGWIRDAIIRACDENQKARKKNG